MKKKDLLKYIPKEMPEHTTARIIHVCRRKVLMSIFPNWEVRFGSGSGRKSMIHFTWRDGYLSYFPGEDAWTREGLEWLYAKSYAGGTEFDEEGIRAIKEYTGRMGLMTSIERQEDDVRRKKEKKARETKQQRIDRMMRERVPALPQNFYRWAERLFKRVKQEKIAIKMWQEKDGYTIERIFIAEAPYGVCEVTEICRAFVKAPGKQWIEWYYGQGYYKYGKKQDFWPTKDWGYMHNRPLPTKHYVYDNLDELDITDAQREAARILSGATDPWNAINTAGYMPEIEVIAKRGGIRLAKEVAERARSRDAYEVFGWADKRDIERVIRCNGGLEALRMVVSFPYITDKNLKDYSTIKSEYKAWKIREVAEEHNLNINHLYALWRKTGGVKEETLRTYEDYLNMADELGNDITEEIIYRNKRWREWHDRYVQELNRRREDIDKAKRKKKWRFWAAIERDYERNRSLFEWQDGAYCIIVPRSAEEINEEGRRQHHCVGAQDQYKDKMARRETFIVFLRKSDEPDEPYYTIETDGTKLLQWYGAYDRKPDEETVGPVLAKWMDDVRTNKRRDVA